MGILSAVSAVFVPLSRAGEQAERVGTALRQPKAGDFVFNLLPKAFQRTPDLEITVNTELTPYGRLLRQPTTADPAFYLGYSMGFKSRGEPVAGETPPKPEQMERLLRKSLSRNGYEPTGPGHAPSLVIFYHWGSHNAMDAESAARFPVLAQQQRLERAMLIGGQRETSRLAQTMAYGEWLTDRTADREFLRDQSAEDLYFVVASAYDYAALAHGERKLVWRTTMTVSARGVSMEETMAPLLTEAAPYFGRETADPIIATPRIRRWNVQVGEPEVVPEKSPTQPSPK